jgi:hypothetical protein
MIKKFYETTRPEPGKARIHYGKADDSKIAYEIAHGVNTRTSLVVRYHVVDVRGGFTGRSCTPLDLGGGGVPISLSNHFVQFGKAISCHHYHNNSTEP